jgi:hypothetical protein
VPKSQLLPVPPTKPTEALRSISCIPSIGPLKKSRFGFVGVVISSHSTYHFMWN